MTNWQTKKLGDAMEFIPTGAHSRNDMTTATGDEEEVLNIHYGDIHTKYSTYVDCEEDSVPALKDNNIRVQMFLKDGDLVVADASEDYDGVGSSVELRNVSDRKVIGGLHTFALRSKNEEFASGFTGLMLKNPATRKRLMQMSVYSKVYGLTKSSISSVDVSYPEKPEQERIVGVLEVWDEYIEKLEQKIALKEQLKKGLMQQLLAGKRRLPGFSGEWQKTRIGDISNVIAGGTPSTSRQEYWNGGNVLWMKSGEINKTYLYDTEHRITDLGLESSSAKILPMNSVLIALAGQGSTRGKVAINKVPLSTNQSVAAFIPTKRLHYGYLFWNLSTRYDELRSLSAGDGGRGGLNLFILKNLKIKLPEFNEQREICAVLDKCNEEINSLVNYKGLIHRQKKYLLKNLITGTIRTPEDLQPLDASRLERSAL